jgi:PAS domain S-box-containing protein
VDIRKKTVVILCIAIAFLILIFLVLSETVVLEGFSRVEQQSAQKDTNRVLVALGNDINTLDAVAYDWASRDDTRAFLLANGSPLYWSRLDPDTFERLQFNNILLFDAKGNLVAGEGYDLDRHRPTPISPPLDTLISPQGELSVMIPTRSGILGIMQGQESPLMLAIRPVFSDSDNTRIVGYIAMARALDTTEVSRLSALTQHPIQLQPYNSDLPQDFRKSAKQFPPSSSPFIIREGKEALTIDAPTYIMPTEGNILGTYSLIRDLSGQPILILKVSISRDIYVQGITTTLYFVYLFIISGMIIGLVILLLLEKAVISRILFLGTRMSDIGKTRDFSARVNPGGDDEIWLLAETINGMLGELATSQEALRGRLIQSEEKYRLFFNSIKDPVIIYRPCGERRDNMIIEANDAATALLGYLRQELLELPPEAVVERGVQTENPTLFQAPETEGFVQYESSLVTKGKKSIPVEISAWKFYKFGEAAVLMIARDITDRKRAERALQQANKKLNLLNSVTFNDFQNALFAIKGYLALQKGIPHDPGMDGYLAHEDEILKRFSISLDFAKNYQDLGIKPPRWYDVHQTFLVAMSRLDFSRISRTIRLDTLEIYADPLLEQVFFILAENITAHGKNATHLTISYTETADHLLLAFEDNGAGIPPDKKEKIFQRVIGSQNNLGLFFAREILDITGITIRETGIFGSGARFEITVPAGMFRFMSQH